MSRRMTGFLYFTTAHSEAEVLDPERLRFGRRDPDG